MFFMKSKLRIIITGACAGAVNGLFGTGGGMVLVPLLTVLTDIEEDAIFPSSVSIILPVCFISLFCSKNVDELTFLSVLPYLIGSTIGGILCGILGKKIPTKWLHRILGILILWGGVRYLC